MSSNDFLTFSPNVAPSSILKPVCDNENLMVHQTPIHKNLKVSFQTPARTPLGTIIGKDKSKPPTQQAKPSTEKCPPSQDWRDLDEELKWKERIEVVTKADHKEYVECAKGFIEEVITDVVDKSSAGAKETKGIEVDKNANITAKPNISCGIKAENKENKQPPDEVEQTPKLQKIRPKKIKSQKMKPPSSKDEQQNPTDPDPSDFGGYNLDNIDLDSFNPFSSSKCLANSPKQANSSKSPPANMEPDNAASSTTQDISVRDESISCVDLSSNNPFEDSYFSSPMTEIFSSMSKSRVSMRNSNVNHKALTSLLTPPAGELSLCNLDDTAAAGESPQIAETNEPRKMADQLEEQTPLAEPPSSADTSVNNPDLNATLTGEEAKDQSRDLPPQPVEEEDVPPQQASSEPADMGAQQPPEVEDLNFVSAEALMQNGFDFDLDFLANKGEGVVVPDLHKHSLYLKFDPLVSQEERLGRLSTLMGRKSDIIDLCGRVSLARRNLPLPTMNEETETKTAPDFLCDSPSKFMRDMDTESQGSEGRSSNISDADSNEEIIEVLRYSETEMRRLIDDCREPLEAKVAESAVHMEKLQTDNEKLLEILKEYDEATSNIVMNQQIEEKRNQAVIEMLEKDKEELKSHLESIEKAYMELLKRMDQMKSTLATSKKAEQTYKKVIEDLKSSHETSQKRYKALKQTMEEREQKLTQQHQKKEQEMVSQITGLKARCKYLESQSKSLKSQVEQTTSENKELTKICDELIEQQAGKT